MSENIRLIIDDKQVTAAPGQRILQAAAQAGIEIPTLCHLEGLTPDGSCRLCVVELADGRLVQACTEPCTEGMVVKTRSPKVIEARKWVLSLLLNKHLKSCFSCANCSGCNGVRPLSLCGFEENCFNCPAMDTCKLREYALEYKVMGRPYSIHMEEERRQVITPAGLLRYDADRCILCRRCVRTCQEVAGKGVIALLGRGDSVTLDFSAATAGICANCGKCADNCSTGALTRI